MLHRQIRGALVAIAALCSLAVASSATAAPWQGPIRISGPVVNASAGTSIALGVSGDAAAAWSDDGAGGEIVLVRKRAGSAWSSPDVPAGAGNGPVFTGVDGLGNITAAYSAGDVTTLLNWPATATAAVATPLGVPMTVTDLAVDASGDAVIAGLSGSPAGLTVGYRRGRDGEFSLHTYTSAELGSNATSARVAIDESLGAAVLFVSGPKLLAATRTAATDWPATPETVEGTLTVSGDPAVTFDSAGALLAAFTYETATPAKVLRTARRQDGGSWLESGDLTLATPNSSADSLNLEAGPAGEVALVWNQTSAFQLERQGAVRLIHHRRVGADRGRQLSGDSHSRRRHRQ
ncbi:MAG TPA: hypothetical protein VFD90_18240 [Gaiellales bacterium]|nr:hypothetical protein [Gaiellales bacterium]